MHARKALLKKLASVTGSFEGADARSFKGETCIETRNTIYRFRDGVCFAVVTRDWKKGERAASLMGLRLVGWLVPGDKPGSLRLSGTWQRGSCAVLWRPSERSGDDGTLALTSPTSDFAHGLTSERLQAFHDAAPPRDSALHWRTPQRAPPSSQSRS